MKEYKYDEDFEKWFNSEILPNISENMVLVAKSMMEVGWKAGYDFGIDVGLELAKKYESWL